MKRNKNFKVAILIVGLIATGIGGASADTSASPKPSTTKAANPAVLKYQAELAAYKIALQQYRVDVIKGEIAYRPALKAYWSAWIATNQAFNSAWQSTWTTFKTANDAYQAKYKPLNATKDAALSSADAAFMSAIASDSSYAGIAAAIKTHSTATAAAQSIFKAAVTALGPEPVRPIKPTDPVKPAAPTKAKPPVQPVAPVKPAVVAKPTKTK